MTVTQEEVKHVANLAKLNFPENQLQGFTKTFSEIVDMVELLDEVEVDQVPFTSNVFADFNVWREDTADLVDNREELLKNAPLSENGFLKVPAILDDVTS